jgi:hypothetical protein
VWGPSFPLGEAQALQDLEGGGGRRREEEGGGGRKEEGREHTFFIVTVFVLIRVSKS